MILNPAKTLTNPIQRGLANTFETLIVVTTHTNEPGSKREHL